VDTAMFFCRATTQGELFPRAVNSGCLPPLVSSPFHRALETNTRQMCLPCTSIASTRRRWLYRAKHYYRVAFGMRHGGKCTTKSLLCVFLTIVVRFRRMANMHPPIVRHTLHTIFFSEDTLFISNKMDVCWMRTSRKLFMIECICSSS
jgi:hypothetical protein